MKRLLALVAAFTFAIIATPVAHASTTIYLTEPTHRQLDGKFIDDDLATSLSFTGRLGELVFNPPTGERTWVIDPAGAGYSIFGGWNLWNWFFRPLNCQEFYADNVSDILAQSWWSAHHGALRN